MGRQLTAEQARISAERKLKKAAKKAAALLENSVATASSDGQSVGPVSKTGMILERSWIRIRDRDEGRASFRLMTWNLLAQTLVRRDLFPSSDCLRRSQREPMIPREIFTYDPDIACLQEVDGLDKLLPAVHGAGYGHTYASGRGKRHGCMILHRESLFTKLNEKTIYYDEEEVRNAPSGDDEAAQRRRRGLSMRTKNIGLCVAFSRKDRPSGCIVGTTHLFWHPGSRYERSRQVGIMVREITRFREENNWLDWPIYLAGDFNFQPTEPSYALVTGDELNPNQLSQLESSRLVHFSVDPSIPVTGKAVLDEEGGGKVENDEKGEDDPDPDRVLTDSRRAIPEDGLLDDEELQSLFKAQAGPGGKNHLWSVYDRAMEGVGEEADNVLGAREDLEPGRKGRYEPMWTNFTHFWRLTLDYIFILDPRGPSNAKAPEVLGVLKTHRSENLEPGLPKLGVCASDHVALVAEIETD
ncbi:hypothetical protein BOTBODRAFT_34103 [Botryobasidium botryosum FD-172 SS1]|uniref:Endonuclease/exonuclease/phosphatase domain-containing protein n=1 Tax=Botryobasidium botryosum (strain FD-172 SS1) TaxID=930990 RepID=A0A067MN14_BOTB1|nr:hypothetical protein BOTBODRAFT_34103 [Botryobasidium botryosum FD-172 SS1]